MQRICSLLLLLALLTGCKGEDSLLSGAIDFRSRLVSEGGCSFHGEITAEYEKEVQVFSMDCSAEGEESLRFQITAPETIADITGELTGDSGTITYDGLQLAFPLMVEETISPVSAPGLLVNCWFKEFILSAGRGEDGYRVTYEKKIKENTLMIDTYFQKDIPIFAELCYNDKRIITIKISNFTYL